MERIIDKLPFKSFFQVRELLWGELLNTTCGMAKPARINGVSEGFSDRKM
jgi:hypothetical protein